jgi:hypothetical protein
MVPILNIMVPILNVILDPLGIMVPILNIILGSLNRINGIPRFGSSQGLDYKTRTHCFIHIVIELGRAQGLDSMNRIHGVANLLLKLGCPPVSRLYESNPWFYLYNTRVWVLPGPGPRHTKASALGKSVILRIIRARCASLVLSFGERIITCKK